jgi:hypothetical protein
MNTNPIQLRQADESEASLLLASLRAALAGAMQI